MQVWVIVVSIVIPLALLLLLLVVVIALCRRRRRRLLEIVARSVPMSAAARDSEKKKSPGRLSSLELKESFQTSPLEFTLPISATMSYRTARPTQTGVNSASAISTEASTKPRTLPLVQKGDWQMFSSDNGEVYFWNVVTHETCWQPPSSFQS